MSIARKRVAVIISGRGSNMAALIEAARAEDYPADIVLVISNRADAAGLERASDAGIKTAVIDQVIYGRDREAFEKALLNLLTTKRIDLVCLAGFMRLLSADFVSKWEGRILNIHPALLPSFKGLNTHERALEAGVRIHGATVHIVDAEMDAGPIVVQGAVPVQDDDTPEALAARVLAVEHVIYPRALRLMAEGRVRVENGRCRIEGDSADGRDTLVVPA